jgi:hypothetical protein
MHASFRETACFLSFPEVACPALNSGRKASRNHAQLRSRHVTVCNGQIWHSLIALSESLTFSSLIYFTRLYYAVAKASLYILLFPTIYTSLLVLAPNGQWWLRLLSYVLVLRREEREHRGACLWLCVREREKTRDGDANG